MIRLAAATAAIAVAVLSAGAASAFEYRIAVGDLDLGSATGAVRFDQRVNRAAEQACAGGTPLPDAQCVLRFRVEAFRQLSADRRADYARGHADRLVVRTQTAQR